MNIDNLIAKSLGAVKNFSDKVGDNDKSILEIFDSIAKTISDLVAGKKQLEEKLTQYEAEFKNIKETTENKITYYENEIKKVKKQSKILISALFTMQAITLVLVTMLFFK
jgi:hypothetical protein